MELIIRVEVEGDMYDTRIQGGILADGCILHDDLLIQVSMECSLAFAPLPPCLRLLKTTVSSHSPVAQIAKLDIAAVCSYSLWGFSRNLPQSLSLFRPLFSEE